MVFSTVIPCQLTAETSLHIMRYAALVTPLRKIIKFDYPDRNFLIGIFPLTAA